MKKLLLQFTKVIPLVLLLCFAISCQKQAEEAAPVVDIEADVKAIKDQHHQATLALSRGDLETLMSVYADDVVMMPPNQATLVGKAGIRSMWEDLLNAFTVKVSVFVEEVEVLAEWAFERGTFRMELTPRAGGASAEDFGKYLDILRRQADGSWKYSRLIFNSSKPPQPPKTPEEKK